MKKSKQPTHAQAGYIRDTAIELGVTGEMLEIMFYDGTFTKYLKESRDKILVDRANCRPHELKATVYQDRPYTDVSETGCSDSLIEYIYPQIVNLYPPVSEQKEEVLFVLRNSPMGGGSWDKALSWAKSNGYKVTNPREAFSVIEQHDLLKLLGHSQFYLAVTMECYSEDYRRAVSISVGELCQANLERIGIFDYGHVWFLFRK
jgi:hypothetical protein